MIEILISKGADINAIDIIYLKIKYYFELKELKIKKGN